MNMEKFTTRSQELIKNAVDLAVSAASMLRRSICWRRCWKAATMLLTA